MVAISTVAEKPISLPSRMIDTENFQLKIIKKIKDEKLKEEAIDIRNFVMKRVYNRKVEECTKCANNQDKEWIIKKSGV